MSLTDTSPPLSDESRQHVRVDLAAAFRWTARLNMHEGISNHFSYVVADDPCMFLVNPYGKHFSKMRASDLITVRYTEQCPKLVAAAIDEDGWLHTGDLAATDNRGYTHPSIAEVAVVGLPDDKYGEVVGAFVRPAPGRSIDEAELGFMPRSTRRTAGDRVSAGRCRREGSGRSVVRRPRTACRAGRAETGSRAGVETWAQRQHERRRVLGLGDAQETI